VEDTSIKLANTVDYSYIKLYEKVDSCGIKEILDKIDDGQYLIPSFQREFVWDHEKVLELIRSLSHGYPIGTLLFCPVNDNTFKFYRPKTFDYRAIDNKSEAYIILDGQQRLTALHRVFSEKYNVDPDNDEDEKRLYFFKIKINESKSQAFNLQDMEINIGSKKGKISKFEEGDHYIFPLYLLHKHDNELSEWRKTISKSYANKFKKDYSEVLNAAFEIFTNDSTNKSIFSRLNNHELIPYLKLTNLASDDIEKVCDMFDKLNIQGVKLSEFDLIASRMYPKGIDLRSIWHELTNGKLVHKFKIPPIDIMRTMSLIDQLDNIETEYLSVQIRRIRSYMRSFEDEDKFKSKFKVACDCFEESLDHLKKNHGLINKKWIPHNPLLITFSAGWYLINSRKRVERHKLISKLDSWYWCNVFNERFEGSTIAPISEEFEELYDWFNSDKKVPNTVKQFKTSNIELKGNYKKDAIYKGVVCSLIKNGIIDFFDGRKVDNFPDSLDDHHIFPEDYLKNTMKLKDEKKINCTINKTLIHLSTNRSKLVGNVSPNNYLKEIKKILGENKFKKLCKTHLLDSNLDSNSYNNYNSFLKYREKLIKELINENISYQ